MNQRTHFPYLVNILQLTKLTYILHSLHDNLQRDKAYNTTPGQTVLNPDMGEGLGPGSNLNSPTYLLCGLGQVNCPVPQFPYLWNEDNSAHLIVLLWRLTN